MSSLCTHDLHCAFLSAFGNAVQAHSDLDAKPLDVDLRLPLPPRIRAYMYNLVNSDGRKRRNEHKAVLRVPGQRPGEYGSFEYPEDRIVLLCGYEADLNVFVLWDAGLHPRFKWGGNIQVKSETVFGALTAVVVAQQRTLSSGQVEVVLASRSDSLGVCLNRRLEASIMGSDGGNP